MKQLDHANVLTLYEVLDDPQEDSLFMVLELCEKGVIMKLGVDNPVTGYAEPDCRIWFRDLILGIEYLHAQGIVHRDIKPDNLLLTHDDVLKIADYGVSQMFDKDVEMRTAQSAGSPAFLPPELCATGHGPVCGKAADIWSMSITLYCLCFGRLPFAHANVLELYHAIRHDNPTLQHHNSDLVDLMHKILDKNPASRIRMDALRVSLCPSKLSDRSRIILGLLFVAKILCFLLRKTSRPS